MNLDPLDASARRTAATPRLDASSSRASVRKTAAMRLVFASAKWRARAWPVRSGSSEFATALPVPDYSVGSRKCRGGQCQPASTRNASNDDATVSVPTNTVDLVRYELEEGLVVRFDVDKGSPVDPQDIPLCDPRHLGKDRRHGFVLKSLCMKIEKDAMRRFRPENVERGTCPISPNVWRALCATRTACQQQAGQAKHRPPGDVHLTPALDRLEPTAAQSHEALYSRNQK